MPSLDEAFPTLSAALALAFGPAQSDFLGLEPFEAMIAVLLDRNLAGARWKRALDALDRAGLLTPFRLAEADLIETSDALRAAGVSSSSRGLAPLKNLARWLVKHHGGRIDALFDPHRSAGWLRGELAAIHGIGVAGADAILLFALKRPSYPVDRATYRVLVRHAWLDSTESYEEARDLLVDHAAQHAAHKDEDSASSLEYLSVGMHYLGRRYCRAAAPRCDGCPLEDLLPQGGPRDFDA